MERTDWTENTGGAPQTDDNLKMTELMGGVEGEATDLGDDANRTATNLGATVNNARRGQLEGGLDAGGTDLGADVERPAADR